MQHLERITVTDGNEYEQELGSGKLGIGDEFVRIHLPGQPDVRLPDRDIVGLPVIASDESGVRYTGEIVDVVTRADAPVPQRVVLWCVPATRR